MNPMYVQTVNLLLDHPDLLMPNQVLSERNQAGERAFRWLVLVFFLGAGCSTPRC